MGWLSGWMGRLSRWILRWIWRGGLLPYGGYGGYGGFAGYGEYGFGYGYGTTDPSYTGTSYPSFTYTSGYTVTPAVYTTQAAAAPYLTSKTYEPGDGYRYPLYYDPTSGQHMYYPAAK